MELRTYRPPQSNSDDRHGTVNQFVAGQPIRGANGAVCEKIEARPEGVLVTLATSSVRYSVLYTPTGIGYTPDVPIKAKANG